MTDWRGWGAGMLLPALVLLGPAVASRYPDQPPAEHTGGFGEPTCSRCHFDYPANEPPGFMRVEGVPASYTPGAAYTLVVTLTHPEIRKGGFQIAARFAADGAQAGMLRPADLRAETTATSKVRYIHQNAAGTELTVADTARWKVEWIAPESAGGPVLFHFAGNAANGDNSAFGDRVYADSARSSPAR